MDLYLCNCQSFASFRANPKGLVDHTAEEICKFALLDLLERAGALISLESSARLTIERRHNAGGGKTSINH
jgi:hypothetical protein